MAPKPKQNKKAIYFTKYNLARISTPTEGYPVNNSLGRYQITKDPRNEDNADILLKKKTVCISEIRE